MDTLWVTETDHVLFGTQFLELTKLCQLKKSAFFSSEQSYVCLRSRNLRTLGHHNLANSCSKTKNQLSRPCLASTHVLMPPHACSNTCFITWPSTKIRGEIPPHLSPWCSTKFQYILSLAHCSYEEIVCVLCSFFFRMSFNQFTFLDKIKKCLGLPKPRRHPSIFFGLVFM